MAKSWHNNVTTGILAKKFYDLNNSLVGVNHAPVALAGVANTNDTQIATGNYITSFASDLDANNLTVTGLSYNASSRTIGSAFTTTYGTMNMTSTGAWTFTPNSTSYALKSGQSANEVFTVTVSDGQGGSASSTLTVHITGQNNAPIAIGDVGNIPYNSTSSGNVLSNDSDPDQGTLSVTQFSVFGFSTYTAGQTATLTGIGSLQINSNGAWTFTPVNGYSGTVPVVTYTLSNGTTTATATFNITVAGSPTNTLSDPVTVALTGTHATYNVYSDTDMNTIPWGALVAGDVVNIFWKSTPYRAKFALRAQGTAGSPVIVNGVTDSSGNRPQFDWSTNAFTAAGCNPSNGYGGATDIFGDPTAPISSGYPAGSYGEGLGGLVITRGPGDGYNSYVPSWIQIKNIDFRGAHGKYTSMHGALYDFAGAQPKQGTSGNGADIPGSDFFASGIHILMSTDCLIENCFISDCGNGLFVQANNGVLAGASTRLKIRNCKIYGNSIAGRYYEHSIYIQCASPIIEGCYMGQNRVGSLGSTYKSRSSGEIVRYNYIEASARALDFVHSEDNAAGVAVQSDYGITWCYGNTIVSDQNLPNGVSGNPIHYGGDNLGEQDTTGISSTILVPTSPYRSQLYFWNNTYVINADTSSIYYGYLFQLSLVGTRVDAWNNIFVLTGTAIYSWLYLAGVMNLRGINQVYGTVVNADASATSAHYTVNNYGSALVTGDPLFVDLVNRDTHLTYSSGGIDIGTSAPSGLPSSTINSQFPVEYQSNMKTNGLVVRNLSSGTIDLGSTEYGVGYTPPPAPTPSVVIAPSITGSRIQGNVLTANTGTWIGRPTFTYQWLIDATPISGATSSTYTTAIGDLHHNISVSVTGTNTTSFFTSTTSSIYVISATAPVNSTLPAISGTAMDGNVLTASTGSWTNSPVSYAYQWLRNGSILTGSTASTYTVVTADIGQQISVRVSATNATDTNDATSSYVIPIATPADPDPQGTFNFSAANGTTLATLNSNWQGSSTYSTVRYECVNGALQCLAGTGNNGEECFYSFGIPTTNQSVEVKILGNWDGVYVLQIQKQSSSSGYYIRVTPTSWQVYRGGTWQNQGSLSINTVNDLYIKIIQSGSNVNFYINGTSIYSLTDSTPLANGSLAFYSGPGTDVSKIRMDYFKTVAT